MFDRAESYRVRTLFLKSTAVFFSEDERIVQLLNEMHGARFYFVSFRMDERRFVLLFCLPCVLCLLWFLACLRGCFGVTCRYGAAAWVIRFQQASGKKTYVTNLTSSEIFHYVFRSPPPPPPHRPRTRNFYFVLFVVVVFTRSSQKSPFFYV